MTNFSKYEGDERVNKGDLKKLLAVYPKIRSAVIAGKTKTQILQYGRKKSFDIPNYAGTVEKSLQYFLQCSDEIIRQITDQVYIHGYNDRAVFIRLPISESSFYRIKKAIEEKIFGMCILAGYVSEEEILSNRALID